MSVFWLIGHKCGTSYLIPFTQLLIPFAVAWTMAVTESSDADLPDDSLIHTS